MSRAKFLTAVAAAGVATVCLRASGSMPRAATATVAVDGAAPGAAIPRTLYGVFYEEISHAGDGGLYAELVQNRGFEDANLPHSCTLENGFVVPPRTPHFDNGRPSTWRLRWDVTSPHPAWSLQASPGSDATIAITAEQPLNDATPHSLRVNVGRVAAGGRVALVNDGYWGMGIHAGDEYRLSFFARADATFRGPITAAIERADGTVLATATAALDADAARVAIDAGAAASGGWRKYRATLRATAADPKARLALVFGSAGTIALDMVSLFPAKTFKNRPNGLRPDLAQLVADLRPGFIRGPGGCFAEGITIESRPHWKRSIGPIETRSGTYSPWGYWSTDGFGYHEFLQFAEDIGADALYVVSAGVSCSFRSGTFLPDEEVPALIQDALDAIEYAIGPVSSRWGAERAKHGHPQPFPLKYVEVGNEQQGARYGERVAKFTQAIKAKYPQMRVALSSWISGIDRAALGAAGQLDIVDEHAYKPLNWAIENFDSFAKYPREGWDLYIGEFATNAGVGRGNWIAALNDAVYMMNVEKNTDLVKMASYAPLLENVNKRDWEVNMIHFDASRVFARATYYVQKLFTEHLPSVALKTGVEYVPDGPSPIAGPIGVGTWNTAAEFKDVRVEQGGRVVYQSNFTTDASGFAPATGRGQGTAGTWTVADGAYRQTSNAVGFSWVGTAQGWTDVTVSLKARKISGAEGFLVLAGTVDGRRVQWNVGGWNNRQTALQAGDAIVGQAVRGTVETGRWYDVRVEVRDRTVRGYLDGVLISEATYPRVDTVLAIAGRDDRTGDVIIKAVNTSAVPVAVTFRVTGTARPISTGQIVTMSSAAPTDENSFEMPTKIVPVASPLGRVTPEFVRELPPYSLSILRVR
jgi:alpha-L-arabinofuranosidase